MRQSRRAHHDPADYLLDTSAVARRGATANGGGGSGRVWAAMMIALAMVTVAGAWWWMLAPTSRAAAPPRQAELRPAAAADAPEARVPAAPTPAAPAPTPGVAPAPLPRQPDGPRAPAAAAATRTPQPSLPPAAEVQAPPVAADPAVAPIERDDAIFSSTSPGVEPPAPLTPLPSGTTVIPGEATSGPFVEVLVDRNGQVEDVKLRGEPGAALARYQEAVTSVRRWRFVPAQLNGNAVRYALRVVLPP